MHPINQSNQSIHENYIITKNKISIYVYVSNQNDRLLFFFSLSNQSISVIIRQMKQQLLLK